MSSSTDTTPSTVGIIGAGNIGATIARRAAAAGWNVVISNSRGPASLADLVAELGDGARAAFPAEAAAAGDLVVVSIPFDAHRDLPAEQLIGKTVIDTTNYYPGRDQRIAELDDLTLTSSEVLQRHIPGAMVVKAFNNVDFVRFAALPRPAGSSDRAALPVSADSADALTIAAIFLDVVGYDAVTLGTLAESWRQEPNTPVYVAPYYSEDSSITDAGQRFYTAAALALTSEQVHDLAGQATRAPAPVFPTQTSQDDTK